MAKDAPMAFIPQVIPRVWGAVSQGTTDEDQMYMRNIFWSAK